jgi:predicted acyltransferase
MRFKALDIFRGMTIFLMIIVNNITDLGSKAEPFFIMNHAPWFGFTFADIVFPSFLFAMGTSFSFTNASKLSDAQYFTKLFKRSAILFIIGLLLFLFPFFHYDENGSLQFIDFGHARILGVLQRIALCYLIAGILIRYFNKLILVIICGIILFGYWAILYFGAPSGLQYDKFHNFGSLVDNIIITKNHIYEWDEGFEPEGILGTFPAVVNVIAGYLLGAALKHAKDLKLLVRQIAVIGIVLIIAGNLWGVYFPIAKKLWTSSFVFLCIGIDCLIMAGLVWLKEVKNLNFGGKFFEIIGINPLAIYIFSELLPMALSQIKLTQKQSIFKYITDHFVLFGFTGGWGSIGFAIVFALFCWCFGYVLYRNKIIIKI